MILQKVSCCGWEKNQINWRLSAHSKGCNKRINKLRKVLFWWLWWGMNFDSFTVLTHFLCRQLYSEFINRKFLKIQNIPNLQIYRSIEMSYCYFVKILEVIASFDMTGPTQSIYYCSSLNSLNITFLLKKS